MSERFYELEEDLYFKNRWHLIGPKDDEYRDERDFRSGQFIALRGPLIAHIHTPGNFMDFTQTTSVIPILSARISEAIRNLINKNAQLSPVQIEGHTGFEILIVTTVLECVDEARSDFTTWTADSARPDRIGQYRLIRVLRVDTQKIPPDTHVFRIKNYLRPLIVSQAFVDAILPLNPTGVKLELVT